MSLITCKECGKEISDQATTCPHCGFSVGTKKFCKFCGEQIDTDCVICPKCGKQVEQLNASQNDRQIIINNSSSASASAAASNVNTNVPYYERKPKNKWVSLFLCIFTIFGHKIYEEKAGMAILYFFTLGLFGIGWLVDIIILAMKPNPYYV